MPIPLLSRVYYDGIDSVPYLLPALKVLPWALVLFAIKVWFNGTQNSNERVMHSRVAIVTGGTSGIGAAVVNELAARGTQLILLVRNPADVFTVDYINDLRERHSNELIYAEKCDLSSLHSVRLFATKFIDNTPPRRLDMIVCCAGIMAPPGAQKRESIDGVEEQWAVNYLGHAHLLNLLAPLLRAQPPDRDVRVLLATCPSYLLGDLELDDLIHEKRPYPKWKPWKIYGATKLALMTFALEMQRQLEAYQRRDGAPNNVRLFNVDPGVTRTPGTRRWLTLGSLFGLAAYLVTWPLWWLSLKSPDSGAQSFLSAAMSPECGQGEGGKMLKECRNHNYRKDCITDPEFSRRLFDNTSALITQLEKKSARVRAEEEKKAKKEGKIPQHKKEEDVDTKELIERAKKAKHAEDRRILVEKLLREGELPPLPPKGGEDPPRTPKTPRTPRTPRTQVMDFPDSPARNTRSRSRTPAAVAAAAAAAAAAPVELNYRGNTSGREEGKSTKRRTKKA